jgi:sorting nexin-5/6/32
LANYEHANRALDKTRKSNKDVQSAELAQQEACEKFENISKVAKQELNDFKQRRVAAFRKNFTDLVELEIKHAKAQVQLFKNAIASLNEASPDL